MPRKQRRNSRPTGWIVGLIIGLCFVGVLCSAILIGNRWLERTPKNAVLIAEGDVGAYSQTVQDPINPDVFRLKQFQSKNPDVQCILRVPETVIDYPVVQRNDDEEYYLRRNLSGAYNFNGSLFLKAKSDIRSSDVCTVFGHNLGENSTEMFSLLLNYKDRTYYEKHPVIEIITPDGCAQWAIYAAFTVDLTDANVFRYSDCINWGNAEEYENFRKQIIDNAVMITNVSFDYEDRLLLLSTCADAYSQNSRFVVAAVKQSE